MTLYKIGEENGTKVYKKTNLGRVIFIAFCVLLLCTGIFCGTTFYYRAKYTRLVERNRVELELARTRSERYEEIYQSARDTNNKLGECLQRSTTTLSGLREQLQEIRRRYEEMENLFNSALRCYDYDDRDFNSDSNTTKYEIEDDKCITSTE
jgi:hypothetical protein